MFWPGLAIDFNKMYYYTHTQNAKPLCFTDILVFSPEYIILGSMKIWKTPQWLVVTTKMFF